MTTLRKQTRLTYLPGSPGSPGTPGRPASPARTAVSYPTVCRFVDVSPLRRPDAPVVEGVTSAPVYRYICAQEAQITFYPALAYIAPTPGVDSTAASFLQDFQLGWTGRAASVARLVGAGSFSFRAAANNVGAVIGMSAAPQDTGFSDILYGFYLSGRIARVYQSGVEVFSHGQYVDADVFKVQRAGGEVRYFVNGTQIYSAPAISAPVYLGAALYSGGDAVYAAELTPGAESAGSLQPLSGLSGSSSYTGAIAAGAFQPLTGASREGVRSSGAMLALVGQGSEGAYAASAGSMQPMAGGAEGFAQAPAYALSSGTMDYMIGASNSQTGEIAGAAGALLPLSGLGYDRPFCDTRGVMSPMTSTAFTYEALTEASIYSGGAAATATAAEVVVYVVMDSAGTAVGVLTVQQVLNADVSSGASAASTLTLAQVIEALLASQAAAGSLQFDNLSDLSVWVMNAATAGTTRYDNYNYNSFAKIGAKHYGARADGIYELTGASDAGAPVRAVINLGNTDFGTSRFKHVKECYLGVASSGKMIVKVVVNNEAYFYTARASSTDLSTQRVDFGRGLKANFYELELHNDALGGAFELSSVEFTPAELSRRI